jgi:hypothetical protein
MISTENYLEQTQSLLDNGEYTDGCTSPFKNYIHKWLDKSKLLCAAHDFGSLGKIIGVKAGWRNNLQTLLAHFAQSNPIYWIWGLIVALATLPWVVFRRDLNQTWMPFIPFHSALLLIIVVATLAYITN